MSLELWLGNGWVKEHKPTPREIAELLAVADRALKDCQYEGYGVATVPIVLSNSLSTITGHGNIMTMVNKLVAEVGGVCVGDSLSVTGLLVCLFVV